MKQIKEKINKNSNILSSSNSNNEIQIDVNFYDVDNDIDVLDNYYSKNNKNNNESNNENNNELRINNENNSEVEKDDNFRLTIDFMMIIGKYFENSKDFVNIMKVNKQYQELASMYHFNPISDTDLFENLETQHFYNESDLNHLLKNKFQYINWTDKFLSNDTKLDNRNKLIYYDDSEYDRLDGNLIFDNNVFNKRLLFTFNMSRLNGRDYIRDDGNGRIIFSLPNEFSGIDKNVINGINPIYQNITEIYLNDNINFLSNFSFYNLDNLETLKFPDSHILVTENTVYECVNLKRIYIFWKNQFAEDCFNKTRINQIILTKYFDDDKFYDYIPNFKNMISFRSNIDVSAYNDDIAIRIFVKNVTLIEDNFIRNKAYLGNVIIISKNFVETKVNGIRTFFVFDVNPGYLDDNDNVVNYIDY